MSSKSISHRDRNVLGFGKHAKLCPDEIAEIDPSYIVWLYGNIPGKVSKMLYLACVDAIEDGVVSGDGSEFLND